MRIYTKSGDKGQTSLYDRTRVDKDDIRVEAYGTIDELNSVLGLAVGNIKDEDIKEAITWIQHKLFSVAGELATVKGSDFPDCVSDEDIKKLEEWIDKYIEKMGSKQAFRFILPGSDMASGALHLARTVCRRAERRMMTLAKNAEISVTVMKFVNRLSDTIFTFARYIENEVTLAEFNDGKR